MTIREAFADLERRTRELLEHEDACGRCYRAARYAIKSREPSPRARRSSYVPPTRCIRGLVRWRRWCRARDVFRATTRLRARGPRFPERPYSAPELPPIPAPVEPPTDLEALEREQEKKRKHFARQRWWRTRRTTDGGD